MTKVAGLWRADGEAGLRPAGAVGGQGRAIGVLVSGEGTNLQALIDAGLPIGAVASNRKDARALERARAANVPAATFPLDCHAARDTRYLSTQPRFPPAVPLGGARHDHEPPGSRMPAQRLFDGAGKIVLDWNADRIGRQRRE